MKSYFYILFLTLLAFTACDNEFAQEPGELVSLNMLTPVILTNNASRAKPIEGEAFPFLNTTTYSITPNTSYDTYYSTAFFVCNKGSFEAHITGANNSSFRTKVHYDYRYQSTTYSWVDGTPQARIGRDIDIYAYYPRVNQTFDPDAVPFTTNQEYDWMWAEPVTINNVNTENKTVPLRFHHAMTCIEVRLSTQYASSMDLNSITLTDAQSKLVASGTMDIRDGSLTYTANQSKITISCYSADQRLPVHEADHSSYRSFCFLIPEKEFAAGDLTLTFRYDGGKYGRADYTIPTTFTNALGNQVAVTKFETGKRYILNLMIDNTDLIVPLSFVTDDWVTNDVNLKI